VPTYPISQPPDNAAQYTWTQPIRDAIIGVNDHQTRVTALESAGGGGAPTIQDEGVSLTVRTKINFVGSGATVTDDPANGRTQVAIPGASGGANPDNALIGTLVGDATTDNSTTFQSAYTTVAGSIQNHAPQGAYSNLHGTKIIDIPAGVFKIVSPGALLKDLGTSIATGLTIRGRGRSVTGILFAPTTANQYLMDNVDWMSITFEDISFISAGPNASTASFMKSTSDGGPQNYVFNRCNWEGTWKYGLHLLGTNVNSELSWYHCGIYGNWTGAYLFDDAATGSDQFLNYNFFSTQVETNTGNFIDMAKGGNINIWGGSWIHIGDGTQTTSAAQTFLKLRGGDHFSGVQRVMVQGTRVEHRHQNSTIIDCEWKRGSVTFIGLDTECYDPLLTTPSAVVAAKFFTQGDVGPVVSWTGCQLMGKHQYSYDNANGWQYTKQVTYRSCEITTMTRADDFIIINSIGAGTQTGGKPVISFYDCRSAQPGNAGYLEHFDANVGWQTAVNGQPQRKSINMRFPDGTFPLVGDPTWNVKLPINAVITKVRIAKTAGGSSTITNATYTLRDANSAVVATMTSGGAAWNTTWTTSSADLWFNCNSDNARSLTVTATNIAERTSLLFFVIDYYS
jgi:hypothetical protein